MEHTYFKRVAQRTPTKFWINNVTQKEADLALDAGAVGCTQNPSYVYKMLVHKDYSAHAYTALDEILKTETDVDIIQEKLQLKLVGEIAQKFLPLWEQTKGDAGYVSVQGNPFKEDTESIIENARLNRSAGPNIMAKVPATKEGLEAIGTLISEGIPINATEVMGVRQALDVCDIYDEFALKMENPPEVYFSHITGIYDEYLQNYVKQNNIDVSNDSLWQAGMIIAKKVHALTKERNSKVGFIGGGARGLHHFTEMVGADCCITINWKGSAENLIEKNPVVIDRFHAPVSQAVLDELLEKVGEFAKGWYLNGLKQEEYEDFGPVVLFRNSFEKNWDQARELIKKRQAEK